MTELLHRLPHEFEMVCLVGSFAGQQSPFLPFLELGNDAVIFNGSNNLNTLVQLQSTFRYGDSDYDQVWVSFLVVCALRRLIANQLNDNTQRKEENL